MERSWSKVVSSGGSNKLSSSMSSMVVVVVLAVVVIVKVANANEIVRNAAIVAPAIVQAMDVEEQEMVPMDLGDAVRIDIMPIEVRAVEEVALNVQHIGDKFQEEDEGKDDEDGDYYVPPAVFSSRGRRKVPKRVFQIAHGGGEIE